ncbi:unnamed protein product [Paramecium sonneborni]|uniref:Uncharacterized protein n=1 Tax=Paramecium sonneborni TaxID=65129 RepID=A0A8S1LYN7_9CILI|nr:unnamed protein product [Paramecium sonneborni]
MNKKEIKEIGDSTSLTKTSLLKIESKEGLLIYIFTKLFDHPIRQQIKFAFGQINVFIKKQGIKCFKSEMNSMECLNQGIYWDQKYFYNIILCLERPDKDFSYSFRRSEGNEQIPCDYVLTLFERVHKLNEYIQLKIHHFQLWIIFTEFLKIFKIKQKWHIKIWKKNLQIDIEFIINQSQYGEEEIKKKFVHLLNEKKKKIFRLNQINGLISNQIIEQEQQNNQINVDDFFEEKQIPVKKQYDDQWQNSLFPVSQIDQFLFTQDTQNKKDLKNIQSK